jgi:hypothetical protein
MVCYKLDYSNTSSTANDLRRTSETGEGRQLTAFTYANRNDKAWINVEKAAKKYSNKADDYLCISSALKMFCHARIPSEAIVRVTLFCQNFNRMLSCELILSDKFAKFQIVHLLNQTTKT